MVSRGTMDEFKRAVAGAFTAGGLEVPAPDRLEKFGIYFSYLVEQNKTMNLTAITDPVRSAYDHFYDSAMPSFLIERGENVIDIGAGAGFPVVPLAVVKPGAQYTALDATGKKCGFVKEACSKAKININVVCARAEEAAKDANMRENFDIAVSRAVARLNVLMELCSPFIKTGGRFFAYKSDPEEIKEADSAALELNLRLELCAPSLIPENGHKVFVYRKTKNTPSKYPRTYSKIKKSPL